VTGAEASAASRSAGARDAYALTGRPAQVVRAFAALDLAATLPLALPPLAWRTVDAVFRLEAALGGAGAPPALDGFASLVLHLAGALGVLWAAVRLARPSRFLGLADAAGRAWVAAMILYGVAGQGAPRLLLVFVASELAGALAQPWVLRRSTSR